MHHPEAHGAYRPARPAESGRPPGRAARCLSGPVPQLSLAVLCGGYAAGAVWGWGSSRMALIMGDFGLSAAALLAAGSCLRFACTRAGALRAAWTLFGLSSLMMALGNLIWGWYEVVLRQPVPRTSLADICYLLFAPLAIIGLLMLASRPVTRAGWIRLALDAWLVGGSLMTLTWSVALAHTAHWQDEAVARAAFALAYPLLDIALVSMVLVLHFRRGATQRAPINTAIAALGLTVLCDALFTSPMLREQYHSGRLLDAGWFTASLLLACAPWLGRPTAEEPPADPGREEPAGGIGPEGVRAATRLARPGSGPLVSLTPYLAAAVCVLSIVVTVIGGRHIDRVVVITACAVVLALLVRQGLTLLDNVALTRVLAEQENYFRSLVQGSSDVIMIATPDGRLRYVSPAASGVYGQEADRLIGSELSALIHPDDVERVLHELRRFLSVPPAREPATRIECRVRHGKGHWLNVESGVTRHEGDLILNSRDVTERVRLQAQLQHSASHDALTDLPNRALFTERVRLALGGARGGDADAAVFFIDLDGFKAVNDTVGHQAGDELLVQAAQRLRESVRAGDTTARLGGDEFAALILGEAGGEPQPREHRVLEIAERVRAALSRPYRVDGRELRVAASIGVAFAEPGATPAGLMRNADLAMYRAKQAGKGRVELYAPQPGAEAAPRGGPGDRPHRALRAGELTLLHQPIVDLADGRVTAVWAQAGWRGPDGGPRPPGEAPPDRDAEVTGWLLEQALAEAGRRYRAGHAVPVAVRVRGPRLADRSLGPRGLEELLVRHDVPPEGLIIELPESGSVLDSAELLGRLRDLSRLGVGLALGGLGSGGTAAAALHRLPVGLVRLDGELVDGLLESGPVRKIAAGLLRMAADLGIDSLADGVDLPAQAAALRALGCRRAQGLAFSEPLEDARLGRVLADGRLPAPRGVASPEPDPSPAG